MLLKEHTMRHRLSVLLTSIPCLLIMLTLAPTIQAPLVASASQPIKAPKGLVGLSKLVWPDL